MTLQCIKLVKNWLIKYSLSSGVWKRQGKCRGGVEGHVKNPAGGGQGGP